MPAAIIAARARNMATAASSASSSATNSAHSTARQIAYLGPRGTYGEQAAEHFARRLGGGVELVDCATIPYYLVMPLENTLHGSVTETVDALLSVLSPSATRPPRIVADTRLTISHQLVARAGTRLADVQWVRSHEQALGQSSAWLDAHLPQAERIKWASTAVAARSLMEEGGERGAAICSRAAYEAMKGQLDLLFDGTQGTRDNYTRFVLLSRRATETGARSTRRTAFYAVREPRELNALASRGTFVAVHQRPAPLGQAKEQGAFPRWTLVELELEGEEGGGCIGAFSAEGGDGRIS